MEARRSSVGLTYDLNLDNSLRGGREKDFITMGCFMVLCNYNTGFCNFEVHQILPSKEYSLGIPCQIVQEHSELLHPASAAWVSSNRGILRQPKTKVQSMLRHIKINSLHQMGFDQTWAFPQTCALSESQWLLQHPGRAGIIMFVWVANLNHLDSFHS